MAITYTWAVDHLECYPTYESQTDVVSKVTWSYRGKDENGIGSSRGGITPVTYTAGSPFTPFNQLTETQVLGWVTPTITTEQQTEMEAGINGDIQWQINQASANNPVSPPLPWPQEQPVIEPPAPVISEPPAPAN